MTKNQSILQNELKEVAKQLSELLNSEISLPPANNEIPMIAYSMVINGWSIRLLKLEDNKLNKPIMNKVEHPQMSGWSSKGWKSIKDNPPATNNFYILVKKFINNENSQLSGRLFNCPTNNNQYFLHYQDGKLRRELLQSFNLWRRAEQQEISHLIYIREDEEKTTGFIRNEFPLPIEVGFTYISKSGWPVTIVARHPTIALNKSFPFIGTWNEDRKPCVALFSAVGQCQGDNYQNDLTGNREY